MNIELEFHKTNEIEHYGVLGMKWGVRKNATKEQRRNTVKKANEKLNKLDASANAKEAKAERRYKKNKTRIEKADVSSAFNIPRREYTAVTSASVARTYSRAQHKRTKALKWQRSMDKVLGKTEATKTDLGKKYANMTLSDITKSNTKINELNDYINRYRRRYQLINFIGAYY